MGARSRVRVSWHQRCPRPSRAGNRCGKRTHAQESAWLYACGRGPKKTKTKITMRQTPVREQCGGRDRRASEVEGNCQRPLGSCAGTALAHKARASRTSRRPARSAGATLLLPRLPRELGEMAPAEASAGLRE